MTERVQQTDDPGQLPPALVQQMGEHMKLPALDMNSFTQVALGEALQLTTESLRKLSQRLDAMEQVVLELREEQARGKERFKARQAALTAARRHIGAHPPQGSYSTADRIADELKVARFLDGSDSIFSLQGFQQKK